jgi:hypothetical protein
LNAFAKRVAEEVKNSAKLVVAIFKAAYVKRVGIAKVRDVEKFLADTAKKSRIHGHKGACRELLAEDCYGKGGAFAAAVARTGYKAGRRPSLVLPKKTRVVVSQAAQAKMMDKQRDQLKMRAYKHGWTLHFAGQQQQNQPGQGGQGGQQGGQKPGQGGGQQQSGQNKPGQQGGQQR